MQKVLNVHIGQVKIARHGELLKAILGSCVGVGIIWKEKQICGLAHCLLPESPTQTYEIGGRFVDQAIRSLIAMMKLRTSSANELTVIIVGGGNMTSISNEEAVNDLVGASNFKKALNEVEKYGFKVTYSENGGDEGRKIYVDASSFSYKIEKIPRIFEVA